MFRQRVATAAALLGLFLPTLFYQPIEPFAVFTLILIAIAGWEWSRLNGLAEIPARIVGLALGSLLAFGWWRGGLVLELTTLWLMVSLFWVLIGAWVLACGAVGWLHWPASLRLIGGVLILAAAWVAIVQARQLGLGFLLSILTLVWMADIAAYFGGKAFGRHKLAPTISPGKSWEGVLSGVLGVLLLVAVWLWLDRSGFTDQTSLFFRLWAWSPMLLVPAVLLLVAMSVVGDLVESLVKRSIGIKDSSQLLPGHGGVLDRVDALLPLLPLAMMFATL